MYAIFSIIKVKGYSVVFFGHFTEADNFCDFLSACLDGEPLQKGSPRGANSFLYTLTTIKIE